MLGALTCVDPGWQALAKLAAQVCIVPFVVVFVLCITTWWAEVWASRQPDSALNLHCPSLPQSQASLITAYTPDTRALVASSHCVMLDWAAFALMPLSPMKVEWKMSLARHRLSRIEIAKHRLAKSSWHSQASLTPDTDLHVESLASAELPAARSRMRSSVDILESTPATPWNPSNDVIEVVEAVGITARSAAVAGYSKRGVVTDVHDIADEVAMQAGHNDCPPGAANSSFPEVQILASSITKAQERCFDGRRCLAWACGSYAGSHMRRIVVVAAVAEIAYWTSMMTASPTPQTILGIAALSTLTWTLSILLLLVVVWYWVRIARSAKRLRYVKAQQELRDAEMAGSSIAWDSGRVSGGLAAPFDATADPYAAAVLGLVTFVFIGIATGGIIASLTNAADHVQCRARGQALAVTNRSNTNAPLQDSGCGIPAFPGVVHSAIVVIGLMLVGAVASNAGNALGESFRCQVTIAWQRASTHVARHAWSLHSQISSSGSMVRNNTAGSAMKQHSPPGSILSLPIATPNLTTANTAVATGALGPARAATEAGPVLLNDTSREKRPPPQGHIPVIDSPGDHPRVTLPGRSWSAGSAMVDSVATAPAAASGRPPDALISSCSARLGTMPLHNLPGRTSQLVREARRRADLLARIRLRIRLFVTTITILGLSRLADALALSMQGHLGQLLLFSLAGIQVFLRFVILLTATIASTSPSSLDAIGRALCLCCRNTAVSRIAPVASSAANSLAGSV